MNKGETIGTDTRRCKHKDNGLDQVNGDVYLAYTMREVSKNQYGGGANSQNQVEEYQIQEQRQEWLCTARKNLKNAEFQH